MTRTLLLDTMVMSEVLRKNPQVQNRLISELDAGADVLISPVVYYEVRRGLLKRAANRLLSHFDVIVAPYTWIEMTRGDWDEAAALWAKVHTAGRPREDSDLLIAAQANRRGAVVVTENRAHYADTAEAMESWDH